ncbi:hypothetical protein HK102_010352, partial [Quaeritorhiza haematococci]
MDTTSDLGWDTSPLRDLSPYAVWTTATTPSDPSTPNSHPETITEKLYIYPYENLPANPR